MRRLGDRLDVHGSALYWHFRNKQALIDAMARAMVTPLSTEDLPDGLEWDGWLEKIANAWRKGMLSHRDGSLVLTSAQPQSENFAFMERLLSKLVASGFSQADAIRGFFTLTSYVLGFVLEEQRGPTRSRANWKKSASKNRSLFASSVAALSDREATFEHGLHLILEGMRAHLSDDDRPAARARTR